MTRFAETLERVCIETVESGKMTKDLAILIGPEQSWMTTEQFFEAIRVNLEAAMAGCLSPASGERTCSRRTPRPMMPAGNSPQQREAVEQADEQRRLADRRARPSSRPMIRSCASFCAAWMMRVGNSRRACTLAEQRIDVLAPRERRRRGCSPPRPHPGSRG